MKVGLTPRQACALRALAAHDAPVTVAVLAGQMTAAGRHTRQPGAEQAATALVTKKLAGATVSKYAGVTYTITDAGRVFAKILEGKS